MASAGKDNEGLLDELDEKYKSAAPARPRDLNVPRGFPYIHYKAFLYLQLGPERYREIDFYELPSRNWDQGRLQRLKEGCRQILDWIGATPDLALENLGIEGFHDLCELFHFRVTAQQVVRSEGQVFIDELQVEHVVDSKKQMALYNKVQNPEQD